MSSRLVKSLMPMSLRVSALASRFVFTFVAVFHMSPEAFGIYGMVASISYVIGQIVGLEAYQVLLRNISQNALDESEGEDRVYYGRFVLVSAALAMVGGMSTASLLGWGILTSVLAAVVIAIEYMCTELMRLLVAENRPDLSLLSVSTRFSAWSYGLPVAAYLGVYKDNWSINLILGLWALSSLIALGFSAPILKKYFQDDAPNFAAWYYRILKESPRWMVVALCSRFLETGYRVIPGFILGEVVAGKFIFLATLSSVGPTGIKAVIEPFWFSRMVDAERGAIARREFGLITAAACALGVGVTFAAWLWLSHRPNYESQPGEAVILAGLLVSAAALALSQVPHFKMYAARDDRAIQSISLAVLLAGGAGVIGASVVWGTLGTTVALALSSLSLLILKLVRSARL